MNIHAQRYRGLSVALLFTMFTFVQLKYKHEYVHIWSQDEIITTSNQMKTMSCLWSLECDYVLCYLCFICITGCLFKIDSEN